nr:RNA-directed DNA polymerase homolog [Tanacetum cinerariifolium]
MLERLAGHEYYCFLDGFLGYFQIAITPEDQEKTAFTCPYGTFAYKRMPFGLCNAPATFQRCMTAIFHELIENIMKVFMDDFSVFGSSFDYYLKNLKKMLKRYEETNLMLNWEKCYFMVKEGIVLDHKVSGARIEKIHKRFLTCRTPNDLTPEFDIEIRDKKRAKNLAADHLSRLENPDLRKLSKAEIRDLFPEELLMAVSDKNNEPCNVLTKSYKGASPKMKQHKSFGNVTADHLKNIMVSPLLQEKSLKPVFTSHISSATHVGWSKFAIHANEPAISLQGKKHLKSTSKCEIFDVWGIDFMINKLDEMRLDAYESSISYKERTKRWHDKQIKAPTNYERGDK